MCFFFFFLIVISSKVLELNKKKKKTTLNKDSPMPLYLGGLAFSSSCSCVLTYSVGKVMQISMPPAIPPKERARRRGEKENAGFKRVKTSYLKD